MAITDAAPPPGVAAPVDSGRPSARKRRTARLFGRDYQVVLPSLRDPRLHVAGVLVTIQVLGQTVLGFRLSVAQILACLIAGALIEFVVAFFKDHAILWPASGLLTGNSTAIILRVPGTLHGDWWSTHGIEIFIGVVAFGMATKYLIRWKGRHIFNPSNVALVLAFVILGLQRTEPLDLFWIPMGTWMIVTYAVLIVGGLLIAWELKLLGLVFGFLIGFAAFSAISVAPVPDHCMVASWHVTALCGWDLWKIFVTSPEILIFAFFMVPDPRTVPDGQVARAVFGVLVALLAVLLLGPTTLEFWTKTAILGSLVVACALRFALVRFVAPFELGALWGSGRRAWRVAAGVALTAVLVAAIPVAADAATRNPQPAAELPDGSVPVVTLKVGPETATVAAWVIANAQGALPVGGFPEPQPGSARAWFLPPIPPVTLAPNVSSFDSTITQKAANRMGHDAVLDLIIESEARRAHDLKLAQAGAIADGLTEFTDVIKQDIAAKKSIQKIYVFNRISVDLYLPKFSTQASRLVGVTLHGTATLITRDAGGNILSQTSSTYNKTWGVNQYDQDHLLIDIDYTGLTPAP